VLSIDSTISQRWRDCKCYLTTGAVEQAKPDHRDVPESNATMRR